MRNDSYPAGTMNALLQSDFVLPQTKEVVQKRLDTPVVTKPSFFTTQEFATLQAVCKRLLPQPEDRQHPIDIAGIFDTSLTENKAGNGWRYDAMPKDEEAYHQGLQAIEASSQSLYSKAFRHVSDEQQDELLLKVQQKKTEEKSWNSLPSDLFFKELLASLVEIYYSHPSGKEEIGDVSFADAKGWQRIQLNDLEEREPGVIKKAEE